MKLLGFRIYNYKCFDDSGWIDTQSLTVIVGKNEAGKTSLLKALHKLNPFSDEPYKMDTEWPRGRRKERNLEAIVAEAKIQLHSEELEEFKENFDDINIEGDCFKIARNYHNELEFHLEELRITYPSESSETEDINPPTDDQEIIDYLKERLPTFIYMSDYRVFDGSADLNEIKQRKDKNRLTDQDKTILTVMDLSGLDLEQEVQKASGSDREQRQYDMDDASYTLTKEISDRWSQKKYEVQFRADGHLFYTFVKDENDPSLIKLEERSKGFQWFFSFDLMFMYESKGTFENCILLLDEPGLHLHPEGQGDLLKRLKSYSQKNTVFYSTHLPFLIDLQEPDSIKIISESDKGRRVTEDLNSSEPEAKFVLQAALGIKGSQSYLLSEKNLVVEGVDDFWILNALSNLALRSGKEGFAEDIYITPAGGASEAVYISTFMIGQDLSVTTLFDADEAGITAKDKLIKKWLTKYKAKKSEAFLLTDILQKDGEFAIEDLFTDGFYLEKLKETYKKQLAVEGNPEIKLDGKGMLCKQVERAMEKINIRYNKGSVAKTIRKSISEMKDISELPKTTQNYIEKLIPEINRSLNNN